MNTNRTTATQDKPVAYSPALAGWKKFSRRVAKVPPKQWIFGVGKYPVVALILYYLAHTQGASYISLCVQCLVVIAVLALISWGVRVKERGGRSDRPT